MGNPEVLSLSVILRKGATIGSTNRIRKERIGWVGSINQDSSALITINHDNIFKNQPIPRKK